MSHTTYGTIVFESSDATLHEVRMYFHYFDTWEQTVSHVERLCELQFGAKNIKRVVCINGSAA